MSKGLTYLIRDEQRAYSMFGTIEEMVIKGLKAGPVVLSLGREQRSTEQNSKFHALIADIHRQCFRAYSLEAVKAVLVQQFANAMEESGTPLKNPGERTWDWKTKEPVYVRPTTTKFTKSENSQFIDFLYAEGSEMGVQWSEAALKEYQRYKEVAA